MRGSHVEPIKTPHVANTHEKYGETVTLAAGLTLSKTLRSHSLEEEGGSTQVPAGMALMKLFIIAGV
jgi:hypothetical protein